MLDKNEAIFTLKSNVLLHGEFVDVVGVVVDAVPAFCVQSHSFHDNKYERNDSV